MTVKLISEYSVTESLKKQVIEWRRHFHRYPELSFQEHRTSQFVEDTLRSFGSFIITRPTPTSVVARLIGKEEGKVVAIRADMDALPIEEENTFAFASVHKGVMHACGHDGHTAILLGVASVLSQLGDEFKGEIRLIFQHAEELLPGGAQELVKEGAMEGVDYVIGTHLNSGLPIGEIGVLAGPMMASPDTFNISIKGKGGHAAAPHEAVDAIVVGAQIVTNLQTIVSRTTNPIDKLVVSVTQFHGGTTHNVLPDKVELNGTVRSFDAALREKVPAQIDRIAKGLTEAYGAEYTFTYEKGYHPVINSEEITRLIEETAIEEYGEERVKTLSPKMGGEDFSAYLQETEGAFFNIGARNEEQGIVYPHHHPKFTVDEDALEIGVKMFLRITEKLLAR
ncbi:M20 family metallopeptidase [Priestia megaterium]|uniref:M20 family metallopeptidase n=1 Tax=Priestia megaterium TaxID=1404 RepID=UPI00298D0AD0|nr:M20 family metallopeptidase [Priestia megaterium]MED4140457.1 M20 family metallopeptidase [Priestia megaterium]